MGHLSHQIDTLIHGGELIDGMVDTMVMCLGWPVLGTGGLIPDDTGVIHVCIAAHHMMMLR